ncbi:heterokaryon incompatibility protein-domain-containing protein, partial [Massariosphaeria phaeospora]
MGKQHPVHIKYPIDLKKNEIRLLEILPGLWSDIVQCEFRIVSLDDNPSYAALSYAWGDAPPEFDITINSYPIKIRPNLFAALRRFRAFSTQKYSVIWADAVCIDQAFTLERNHQVSMMGTIYSKCQEVLIWMG